VRLRLFPFRQLTKIIVRIPTIPAKLLSFQDNSRATEGSFLGLLKKVVFLKPKYVVVTAIEGFNGEVTGDGNPYSSRVNNK
jgi:hypothetical protein